MDALTVDQTRNLNDGSANRLVIRPVFLTLPLIRAGMPVSGSVVEVPCLVDREGIHPCYLGALPNQLAALNQSNIYAQGNGHAGHHGERQKTRSSRAVCSIR